MSTNAIPGSQPQLEDRAVERERLLEIADLERDVVDADQARAFAHRRRAARTRRTRSAAARASVWRPRVSWRESEG